MRARNAPDLGNGVGRSTTGDVKGGFFDVNQVDIKKTKKMLKMKVAPNKISKTKLEKSDIIDYPNNVLKGSSLS
jgi:hypothetical protein